MPVPVSFPGADGVLDPRVDPVGGVDAGGLAAPAVGTLGQAGGPHAVAPAVFGVPVQEHFPISARRSATKPARIARASGVLRSSLRA